MIILPFSREGVLSLSKDGRVNESRGKPHPAPLLPAEGEGAEKNQRKGRPSLMWKEERFMNNPG
jgi:hypothetical protein